MGDDNENLGGTIPNVQGGHASTGLGDGRNIQEGVYHGGGGGGHWDAMTGKVKMVDEFGNEIKPKSKWQAKVDDARYIADLISMLRWLAEAYDKNIKYGTPTPPGEVIDWVNAEVVREIETFYERNHK